MLRPPGKYAWPLLAMAIAAALFYSSSLPGDVSGDASMGIIGRVQNWLPFLACFDEDFLHFLLRKGAHFVSYLALAFCTAHALKYYTTRYFFFMGWGIAAVYGILDEIHQHFVPGRACMFSDMLINAAGAAVGAGVVWWWVRRGV